MLEPCRETGMIRLGLMALNGGKMKVTATIDVRNAVAVAAMCLKIGAPCWRGRQHAFKLLILHILLFLKRFFGSCCDS
jgi:hypothetical protein